MLNEKELSQFIIRSGLSERVSSISDPVALHNLARLTGPYLILVGNLYPLTATAAYRFDIQIIDPLNGETYLEISRVRTNWILGLDSEITYPVLNVIEDWYDASANMTPKSTGEMF